MGEQERPPWSEIGIVIGVSLGDEAIVPRRSWWNRRMKARVRRKGEPPPPITVSASKVQSCLCFIVFSVDLLRQSHGLGHFEAFFCVG